MEVRGYMDGGEAIFFGSGSRWDRTRMEVRYTSWNLDGFEMVCLWIWNTIAGTWLEVRRHLDGGEMQISQPPQISRPGLRWVATWMDARCYWMEVRCKYRDLDWGELRPGWMPGVNLTLCCNDFIPPPSRWQIASIQVTIIASQLYSVPISMPPRYNPPPCPISPASGFLSQLYPCIIWPESMSLNYHLFSIHVAFHSIHHV